MICIYEHKPGPGTLVLGGSGASLENWRHAAGAAGPRQ